MDRVWTWSGKCFGYFDDDDLRTYSGIHVGRRVGDDIFAPDGSYLGEVLNDNRLITNLSKRSHRGSPFAQHVRRAGYAKYADYAGYAMYAGHQDFPPPDAFQVWPSILVLWIYLEWQVFINLDSFIRLVAHSLLWELIDLAEQSGPTQFHSNINANASSIRSIEEKPHDRTATLFTSTPPASTDLKKDQPYHFAQDAATKARSAKSDLSPKSLSILISKLEKGANEPIITPDIRFPSPGVRPMPLSNVNQHIRNVYNG